MKPATPRPGGPKLFCIFQPMHDIELYLWGWWPVIGLATALWLISIPMRNVGIVDIFWGFGFVVIDAMWYLLEGGHPDRKLLLLILVTLWGLRLAAYLAWRNLGHPEDFRYQAFRKSYGAERYWWVSFFQVFLLQSVLLGLIALPLFGVQTQGVERPLGVWDYAGIVVWGIGFLFEAGGDWQLARFKANPANKGKVMDKGFWRYTRHPNYFGDSAVWWGYGLICIGAGSYWMVVGSVLMTALIIRVSGVLLLEKTLKTTKPQYAEYIRKTSAFLPWFPKK
jgi:steroid 5-alpha reductase family enzyme